MYFETVFTSTVSTHSRPKAAGVVFLFPVQSFAVSTHSRPKAAGLGKVDFTANGGFQHTAARRRLVANNQNIPTSPVVSTHSRPKAAG